ncbi:hypothetical protein AYI70_g4794 [Smittium culicis]|uniref:Uncharacterized protein n=1 Tax=Smittium culicis TaxID=133412 RepID=A0A1R1XXE7_9FUNG|nr:hypothetical protein AYI70_g4794 [Smittium culicis]
MGDMKPRGEAGRSLDTGDPSSIQEEYFVTANEDKMMGSSSSQNLKIRNFESHISKKANISALETKHTLSDDDHSFINPREAKDEENVLTGRNLLNQDSQ